MLAAVDRPLLSIAAAREIIRAAVRPLEADEVAISDALGRVLAQDVLAAHDVPPFANSAMDGFAVKAGPAGRTVVITGESRAGKPARAPVRPGEAIRISTGAVLPEGADGVIAVERTTSRGGEKVTLDAPVSSEDNVRRPGEDMRAGTLVLHAGAVLGPAELGVAVSAGFAILRCARHPRVAVVATGDELAEPGAALGPGQIHNSNAVTLPALAVRSGAAVSVSSGVADTMAATENALARALADADVVVISGGVSVGRHDHVKEALGNLGVQEAFWRVALRPGKPTWFGTKHEQLVFGLPGNPVSCYVTFVLFVAPALRALQGASFQMPARSASLTQPIARNPDRDEAVRVRIDGDEATPTGPQGSHVLSSLTGADGLAIVEAGDGELPAGARVTIEAL